MPLVKATIANTIKAKLDAEYGPPDVPGTQEKFANALAEAFIEILTTQMTGQVTGVTGVGSPGGPLPIAAQPVSFS